MIVCGLILFKKNKKMARPNYAWIAVGGITHVGLAPVQAWISVADAVWTSVKTVLDTWKNLLKTLVYPFSNETWKPKWKEDYKKTWWKEWFSGRQKKHWDNYIAPFKWDGMKAPLLAKATWGITHFATAIPTNAVMTALDATYSAIKTPFSILKNIWKTVIYPFSNETWKPTFGKDLKAIWWKEKWFVARTRDSWINTFDVIPKKGNRWKKKIENEKKKTTKNKGQKEIKFWYNIGDNDLQMKIDKAKKLIQEWYILKMIAKLKGREKAYRDIVRIKFDYIEEELNKIWKSQGIRAEDNGFTITIMPKLK